MTRGVFTRAAALAAVVALGGAAGGAPQVDVQTRDGRRIVGLVDARTDAERLWLRQEADGSMWVASSVAWTEVAEARLNGDAIAPATLRQQRGSLTSGPPALSASVAPVAAVTNQRPRQRAARRQVQSLQIVDAAVANFDRDSEPDGLRVCLAAVDAYGRATAVRGSLTAELYGERRVGRVSEVRFDALDRWTAPVNEQRFTDGVATFDLPFRGTAPERMFDLLPDAILAVRLGVFGDGDFDASAAVVLRPLNPMRDNRQLLEGVRAMPGEPTGARLRSRFDSGDGLWLHWTR